MLDEILKEELEELRAAGLYRKFLTLEKREGVHAVIGGRKTLLFCGNDYLGLSRHPRVIEAARAAASACGIGSGAARLISGTTEFHVGLEKEIASFKNKEKALLFTTGYLANLGILTAVAREGDLILMDKLCHASIIDGARLSQASVRVFPHKNYGRCEEILAVSGSFRRKVIVSDAVFSMDGDLADVGRLIEIKKKYGAVLILDDAHGTGVLGPGGGGAEGEQCRQGADIVMGTLSKALGCLGGFAAASETWIQYLINFARPFIFATSLPPMLCAAAMEALKLLREDPSLRERLWKNTRMMHDGLRAMGVGVAADSPILPVMIGPEKEAVRLSEALLEKNIFVPAVRYPTVPKHSARLRVTISADHSGEDIEAFLKALGHLKRGISSGKIACCRSYPGQKGSS